MADGKIGVSGPQPKPSAVMPTHCEAWVEIQGAIDEGNGWIDVRLEVAEDASRVAEDNSVIASGLKPATRKIEAVLAVPLLIVDPAIYVKHSVAKGRQCESHSIVRVTLECLSEQIKCAHRLFSFP